MENQIITKRYTRQYSDSVLYCKHKNSKTLIYDRSFSQCSEQASLKRSDVIPYYKKYQSSFGRILDQTRKKSDLVMNVLRFKSAKTKHKTTVQRIVVFILIFYGLLSSQDKNSTISEQEIYSTKQQNNYKNGILTELLRLRIFLSSYRNILPLRKDQKNMSNSLNISHDSMSDEMMRLYTLRNFPPHINISLIRIAAAGFYHTGHSTETKCYSCGAIYRNWKSLDDPMEIHRTISPSCNIVQNNASRIQASGAHFQHASSCSQRDNNLTTPYTTEASCQHSSSSGEKPTCSSSDQLTSTRNNTVSCSIHHCVDTDNPRESHNNDSTAKQTPDNNIPDINQTPQRSNSNSVCHRSRENSSESEGIDRDRPRYPNYAALQVRKSSYQGWPSYLDQTSHDMSIAGWFYAGYNDYTRCFHCGGGLRNWEAGDDPWVEHIRWFPNCAFIRKNKDEKFINAVLKKQKRESESESNLSNRPHQNDSTSNGNSNDSRLLHCPAAISVLGMGFSNEEVLAVIRKLRNRDGDFYENSISASEIVNILLDVNQAQVQGTVSETSGSTGSRTENCVEGVVVETTGQTENHIFGAHTLQGAVGPERGSVEHCNITQGAVGRATGSTSGQIIPKHDEERGLEVNNLSIGSSRSQINNDTESLLDENRQLREQRICKICLDFDATIAFLPCGHIVCCSDCAPAMRKCPICRAFVKGTVKTFLS